MPAAHLRVTYYPQGAAPEVWPQVTWCCFKKVIEAHAQRPANNLRLLTLRAYVRRMLEASVLVLFRPVKLTEVRNICLPATEAGLTVSAEQVWYGTILDVCNCPPAVRERAVC